MGCWVEVKKHTGCVEWDDVGIGIGIGIEKPVEPFYAVLTSC